MKYIEKKKKYKKFGFQKDREGLITRYLIERHHWETHLNLTKEFIIEESDNKIKGICLILGSGWWLDIPVEELHDMFDLLLFVDISHPPQIRKKTLNYSKIVLVEFDVSGILDKLINCPNLLNFNYYEAIENHPLLKFINNINPDFVVSLNILSQLSFFPREYVKRKTNNAESAGKISKIIESDHLNVLPKDKSCLITDYYQYEYNRNDVILSESERIAIKLPNSGIKKEWIWDFDLTGNYINDKKVRFKVAALQI